MTDAAYNDDTQTSPFVIEPMTDQEIIRKLCKILMGMKPRQSVAIERHNRVADDHRLFTLTHSCPPLGFDPNRPKTEPANMAEVRFLLETQVEGTKFLIKRIPLSFEAKGRVYIVGWPAR